MAGTKNIRVERDVPIKLRDGVTTYVDVDPLLTGSLAHSAVGNDAAPTSTLAGSAAGDMVCRPSGSTRSSTCFTRPGMRSGVTASA